MDTRKRGFCSAPAKLRNFTIKTELSARKAPLCPPLPAKMNRRSQINLFPNKRSASAVFFHKPVALSRLYKPDKEQSYFEQMFTKYSTVGEGSFGVVFKVQSREDDKLYAIKQMKSSHSLSYGYAEVKNYEKIGEHNNCVKLLMAWEELNIIHIQMEYCNLSLAQYANMAPRILESQLWEILFDMLNALDYLHGKNLIHLDVKPGNILMSKGFYKLADFGLLVDLNKHDGQKISTISDGDAKYLASEVLNGIYTYSCDIFGLGISLLELAIHIELPAFGHLWHEIRQQNLPEDYYRDFTRQFSVTIKKMMCSVYWERPKASKILKYPALRKVQKQDLKSPRNNYCEELPDETYYIDTTKVHDNQNIVETPRRPLYEVRNIRDNLSVSRVATSVESCESKDIKVLEENNNSPEVNTERRGLSRVRLTF